MMIRTMTVILLLAALTACATHVHTRYPTWAAYKAAHPAARSVFVSVRPAAGRACWKVPRGWRCVAR